MFNSKILFFLLTILPLSAQVPQLTDKQMAACKRERNRKSPEDIKYEKRIKAFVRHPISPNVADLLIGMTSAQVIDLPWAIPNKVNRCTYSNGTTEQWCFDKNVYLYFRNGVLESWQN